MTYTKFTTTMHHVFLEQSKQSSKLFQLYKQAFKVGILSLAYVRQLLYYHTDEVARSYSYETSGNFIAHLGKSMFTFGVSGFSDTILEKGADSIVKKINLTTTVKQEFVIHLRDIAHSNLSREQLTLKLDQLCRLCSVLNREQINQLLISEPLLSNCFEQLQTTSAFSNNVHFYSQLQSLASTTSLPVATEHQQVHDTIRRDLKYNIKRLMILQKKY